MSLLAQVASVLETAGIPYALIGASALTVHAHAFSASARERIEAAGGTAQTVTD